MKIVPTFIVAPHQNVALPSALNTRTLLIGALLTGSLLLVGCQTTPMSSNNTTSSTPIAAKTALATALQKQRRQSFSYHSNLEISNDAQSTAIIDPKQLVSSDYIDDYCEDTHDQAYAELLAQAEAKNIDIQTAAYETQRNALKQNYLACNQAYEAWSTNQDNDSYEDNYDRSDESVDNDEDEIVITKPAQTDAERVGPKGVTITESSRVKTVVSAPSGANNSSNKQSDTPPISPYYQQLFDNYDDKALLADNKKVQLLDAYLLKPLSINGQGVYQPLAGRFTMLASAQYQTRNHQTSINQPIYVDFKTGNIYLWADNFAMFNAELFDNKLGVKWQNKWLKITLDDGTLPKGFGKALIKAHIKALDQNYADSPVTQFDFIAPSSLSALSPKLSKLQITPMLESQQIIRRSRSLESYKQSYIDYAASFYKDITEQYPELIKEDKTYRVGDPPPVAASFTSKVMMQQVLTLMKGAATDKMTALPAEHQTITDSSIQDLYGFNKSGQLQWHHNRSFASNANRVTGNNQITVDLLQQYSPVQAHSAIFANLPADNQVPNESSSIDLREYSGELAEYYRNGGGTAIGKMLFSMLLVYKGMYATKIDIMSAE